MTAPRPTTSAGRFERPAAWLPLPEGEGWGEGEGRVPVERAPQQDAHHEPVNGDTAPPDSQHRISASFSPELAASLQQMPHPGHSLLEPRRCGPR